MLKQTTLLLIPIPYSKSLQDADENIFMYIYIHVMFFADDKVLSQVQTTLSNRSTPGRMMPILVETQLITD